MGVLTVGLGLLGLGATLAGCLLSLGSTLAGDLEAQQTVEARGTPDIEVLAHLPLGGPTTVSDLEIEQELARPFAYVSRREDFGFTAIDLTASRTRSYTGVGRPIRSTSSTTDATIWSRPSSSSRERQMRTSA
jgi:hypothetical protein